MDGIGKRSGRVLLGTAGLAAAVPVIVVIPELIARQAPWLAVLCIVLKIVLGTLLALASLHQYQLAAFPPGCEALQDPVVSWFTEKQAALWKKSKIAGICADVVVLFAPVLVVYFLGAVALRPVYATMRHPQPGPAVFFSEARQTGRFFWATAKGLFFLTLSTLLGATVSLSIMAYLLYQVSH